MKPYFYIVGAQKCGTTSLYKYLIQHPCVLSAKEKEVHFFSDKFDKGYSWYAKQFPSLFSKYSHFLSCPQGAITGEATPYYIFHPHAARRIHAWTPNARIIMMLRNPVDRAFSHYRYHVKLGVEELSFSDAIDAEPTRLAGEFEKMQSDENYQSENYKLYSYLKRGIYIEQLTPWFELFPKEQILVIQSEEFFSDPKLSFNKTLEFLKLSQYEISSFKKFNEGKQKSIDDETRKLLVEYYKPYNQRLYDLLGLDFNWDV